MHGHNTTPSQPSTGDIAEVQARLRREHAEEMRLLRLKHQEELASEDEEFKRVESQYEQRIAKMDDELARLAANIGAGRRRAPSAARSASPSPRSSDGRGSRPNPNLEENRPSSSSARPSARSHRRPHPVMPPYRESEDHSESQHGGPHTGSRRRPRERMPTFPELNLPSPDALGRGINEFTNGIFQAVNDYTRQIQADVNARYHTPNGRRNFIVDGRGNICGNDIRNVGNSTHVFLNGEEIFEDDEDDEGYAEYEDYEEYEYYGY